MPRLKSSMWIQIFFGVMSLTYLIVWISQMAHFRPVGDFLATYTAIKMIDTGEGHNLYNFNLQMQVQQPIMHLHLPPIDLLPYITPPFFVLPFLPLGFLSYGAAYAVMGVINILLTLYSLNLLWKNLPGLQSIGWITLLLATASFFSWFVNLMQGQNAVITLLILSGTFLLLKHQHDGWAGAVLALGLYKPQLVILFFVVLMAKKRWRAVLAFIGVALGLLIISYALVGRTGLED